MTSATQVDPGPNARPQVVLKQGHDRRLKAGHPWVFANEIEMGTEARTLAPGGLVTVVDAHGDKVATATFNPHALIAARVITAGAAVRIDTDLITRRLRRALSLREAAIGGGHYRLIHAEADGLPGFAIDRYGDVVVVQPNTAGADLLLPMVCEALVETLDPAAIVVRPDSSARTLEGVALGTATVVHGSVDGPAPVVEQGLTYRADLLGGQKTGWFFDQRDNRRFVARFAHGRSVLDAYTHTGGFAVAAAAAGAARVEAVDRSADALALAGRAAEDNDLAGRIEFRKADVFADLNRITRDRLRFGLVIADPPAFAKTRRDVAQGLKGYRKLARLCGLAAEPDGIVAIASCSHHVPPERFQTAIAEGLRAAGRSGRVLRLAGAACDHPVHPLLPETAYLKMMVVALD